jgi:hypothetical protein
VGFQGHNSAQQAKEAKMFEERVYHATDPGSRTEGRLTLLREKDGSASAVTVELSNPVRDSDLILKINSAMSAFIMLTVTDDQGRLLSAPARKFNTEETQHIEALRIPAGSAHSWTVPIASQMPVDAVAEGGMSARVVVNVALQYARVKAGGQASDADFQVSVLTLHDMDVVLTPASLRARRAH